MGEVKVREQANSIYLDVAEIFKDPATKKTMTRASRLAEKLKLARFTVVEDSASQREAKADSVNA